MEIGALKEKLGIDRLSGPLRDLYKKPELFEQVQKNLAELPKTEGLYGMGTKLDNLNRLAMDEALAYLTQRSTRRKPRQSISPQEHFDVVTQRLNTRIERLQEAEMLRNIGEKVPTYRTEKLFADNPDPNLLLLLAEKLGVRAK